MVNKYLLGQVIRSLSTNDRCKGSFLLDSIGYSNIQDCIWLWDFFNTGQFPKMQVLTAKNLKVDINTLVKGEPSGIFVPLRYNSRPPVLLGINITTVDVSWYFSNFVNFTYTTSFIEFNCRFIPTPHTVIKNRILMK